MASVLSKSSPLSAKEGGFLVQAESTSNADVALSDAVAKELVRWFKLLADETRLRIIFFLLEKPELNVRTLCDLLRLSQPAVSHHLALLRTDGLIECRRDGKHNYYHVLPHRFGEFVGKILSAIPGEESPLQFGRISVSTQPADDSATETAP